MKRRGLQRGVVSAAVAASIVALGAACEGLGLGGLLGGDPDLLTCADNVDADVVIGGGSFMDTWIFNPTPATIARGQSVCWVNVDGSDHTVTPVSGTAFGGALSASSTFVVDTFNVAGDFDYFCEVHTEMTGRIHVTP